MNLDERYGPLSKWSVTRTRIARRDSKTPSGSVSLLRHRPAHPAKNRPDRAQAVWLNLEWGIVAHVGWAHSRLCKITPDWPTMYTSPYREPQIPESGRPTSLAAGKSGSGAHCPSPFERRTSPL